MRPIYQWPTLAWLLPGTVGYVLGAAFGYFATAWGWWSDPYGLWMTLIAMACLVVAALLWFRATDRSAAHAHREAHRRAAEEKP